LNLSRSKTVSFLFSHKKSNKKKGGLEKLRSAPAMLDSDDDEQDLRALEEALRREWASCIFWHFVFQ
jgi:hypothetical protein